MEHDLRQYLTGRLDETMKLIRAVVELESPTTNRTAVNRLGAFVADRARELGAAVSIVSSGTSDRGDHVVCRWPSASAGDGRQLLIMVHMDTVWDIGEVARRPFRMEDDRLYGPGIYDMKGSIAFVLEAISALKAAGTSWKRPLTVLFTADEEMNSATSRSVIEAEAKRSSAALVLEGPEGLSVITSRKGIMYFRIRVKGRAAHAGMNHADGVNAVEELAHQILAVQQMTDYAAGTTVNCGIVRGGTRTNVVPAEAVAEVDARIPTIREGEMLKQKMESLKARHSCADIEVYSLLKRPPLEREPGVAGLFEHARRLAAELGWELADAASGAISDGNLTAALGVPTLDGLGPVGGGAHALDEHIVISRIPERIVLLARLIETL